MRQAIAELRAEGLDVAGLTDEEAETVKHESYIDDAVIEETYKVNKDEILRRIKDNLYFVKIKDNQIQYMKRGRNGEF